MFYAHIIALVKLVALFVDGEVEGIDQFRKDIDAILQGHLHPVRLNLERHTNVFSEAGQGLAVRARRVMHSRYF